jgi:hypothetical protein
VPGRGAAPRPFAMQLMSAVPDARSGHQCATLTRFGRVRDTPAALSTSI